MILTVLNTSAFCLKSGFIGKMAIFISGTCNDDPSHGMNAYRAQFLCGLHCVSATYVPSFNLIS